MQRQMSSEATQIIGVLGCAKIYATACQRLKWLKVDKMMGNMVTFGLGIKMMMTATKIRYMQSKMLSRFAKLEFHWRLPKDTIMIPGIMDCARMDWGDQKMTNIWPHRRTSRTNHGIQRTSRIME